MLEGEAIEKMRRAWDTAHGDCPNLPRGGANRDLQQTDFVPELHLPAFSRTVQYLVNYDERENFIGHALGNNLDLVDCFAHVSQDVARDFGGHFALLDAGELYEPESYAKFRRHKHFDRYVALYEQGKENAASLIMDLHDALYGAVGVSSAFAIHVAHAILITLRHALPHRDLEYAKAELRSSLREFFVSCKANKKIADAS